MNFAPSPAKLRPDAIPLQWDQVTAEWVEHALVEQHPGAKIADVKILMQDDGTNRRARIAVTYAAGEGPRQLFLKAHAADHRMTHLRNGNLWNEARLFASNVALPVDHPRVYRSVVDLLGLDFLLVMEDLTLRDADPRDSLRPLTPDQVARGLEGLARLHSLYWNLSFDAHPELAWLQTWEPTEGWQSGLNRFVPIGMERAGTAISPEIAALGPAEVVRLWARYVATLSAAPMTLVHGDAHIGNTYVLPNGDVGFLDWQVVRRGRWSQDMGYFLVGSLTEQDRRDHERDLVELYRKALEVPDRPSAEEVWHEYRATPAYGLTIWLSTLGTDGWQRSEVSLALSRRYATAFEELDTHEALDWLERRAIRAG